MLMTKWAGLCAAACTAALFAAGTAQAQPLEDLAAEAADGPPVVWYESSPEDDADKIIEAFNETYPDIRVQHVRITGGNQFAARAVQETQARGYTADLLTGGADHIWQLNDRGILMQLDGEELGIDEKLMPTDFTVATAASVYVLVYNSDNVSEDEVPTSWDDLLDEKWKGRTGSWVRAASWAQLAKAWGKDKAEEHLREYVKLDPFLFKSTFPMAQQVGAGEVDLAVGFFHTAQPPIQAGAPVKLKALDPTPMHTIYTSISQEAKNAAGAKVMLSWLASTEGNKAYEAATNRGSHLIEGTKTHDLVQGKNVSEWAPSETEDYSVISEEFNGILAGAGEAR
ncbi:extracellular solute-binding protein [Aquicoccus sp. SCR17]|nr:extracellular solute-binding protein [Carideicomes alvinocaridis]